MENEVIRKLIYAGIETTQVDYKKSIPWSKDTMYGLIKDVMSFSNAGGGYIVIGFDEKRSTQEKRRTGVAEEHITSWDATNVSRDINEYCKPPIDVDVITWPDWTESKKYVVLRIPCHGDTPRICVKDKHDERGNQVLRRAAIYFRTKNKTCEEISDPTEFAQIIRRCVLSNRDQLLKEFEQILRGSLVDRTTLEVKQNLSFEDMRKFETEADKYNPFSSDSGLVFWQILAFPSINKEIFEREAIERAAKTACVDYKGWPFVFYLPPGRYKEAVWPRYDDEGIFAYSNEPFFNTQCFYYWKLTDSGIFYSKNLTRESKAGKPSKFDFTWQCPDIAEAIIALGRIYDTLGVDLDDSIEVLLKYYPAKGMQVSSLREDIYLSASQPFQGDSLTHRTKIKVMDLKNRPDDVAADVTLTLLRKLGYEHRPNRESLVQKAKDHLRGGQKPLGCE